MVLTDKLSNIANAIRTKTETTGKMTLTEMPDKILGIQTSEDLDTELTEQQQLISELKTTLENKAAGGVTINNQDKTITENGTYTADSGYTGLGTVTVDVQASGRENKLAQIVDRSITEITASDLNGVERVETYAFYYCKNLIKADLPTVTIIASYAFMHCSVLKSINIPNATICGGESFKSCNTLENIYAPKVSVIQSKAFETCVALTHIDFFPEVTTIHNNAFDHCTEIVEIDFPKVATIYTEAFQRSFRLTRVILRNSSVCKLVNIYAFRWCYHLSGEVSSTYNPEGLKDGYIYVPRDLVESYKSETNWSNFATQFRALEDYTVDGTTTGALDESKI